MIGFIYWRTSDEAATEVHQQVVEQGKVLSDVYRSGGKAALYDAIQDTISYADAPAGVDPGAERKAEVAARRRLHQPRRFGKCCGRDRRHEAALMIQPLRVALFGHAVTDEGQARRAQRDQLVRVDREIG